MSEAKQTAMQDLIHWLKSGWMDEDIEAVIKKAEILLEKEKEQIIEFANRYGFDICHYDYDRAEQYYNKTYENNSNKS